MNMWTKHTKDRNLFMTRGFPRLPCLKSKRYPKRVMVRLQYRMHAVDAAGACMAYFHSLRRAEKRNDQSAFISNFPHEWQKESIN